MQYGKKIGFIGLGEMGKPMAKNLANKGFQLAVFDVNKEAVKELTGLGAAEAVSPKEIGERSEVVITMVRDSVQTDEVLFGKNGLWQGIKTGSVIIISSTLDPTYSRDIEKKAREKDVHVLDAPVSGAKWGSEAGTLTFIVGGEKPVFDECRPVFEAMGKTTFYMGGIGSGHAMKLVNNSIGIVNIVVASEAIAVGLKAGIDLDRMLEVIKVSTGYSWVIENYEYLSKLVRQEREPTGVGGWNADKDLSLAIKFANSVGEGLPMVALASQLDRSRWLPI